MTIVTIHINVSGLKRKSEAFQTLRVFTHEQHFQALKMRNLIRVPKFFFGSLPLVHTSFDIRQILAVVC